MFNLQQAREALAAAVATQGPDFVYNPGGQLQCLYRPVRVGESTYTVGGGVAGPATEVDPRTKTPCLIGVAFGILGVDPDLYAESTSSASMLVNGVGTRSTLGTRAAASYLRSAQCEQDNGATWGRAYEVAEADVERLRLYDPEG